jgi:hypothetical protein
MVRITAWALAGAMVALFPCGASAAAPWEVSPALASQLMQGCLKGPGEAAANALAAAVGATPYSDQRTQAELGRNDTSVVADATQPGQAFRTRTTVTAFRGWDLAAPAAGKLTYFAEDWRQDRILQASGQPIGAVRVSHKRTCRVETPVANAREAFESFEALQSRNYGVVVSADRRNVVVFMFAPDQFDVELDIQLDKPLAGLTAAPAGAGNSRLVLADGGPRFLNHVSPGVPVVSLTRAALLAGLDRPATIDFGDTAIEPAAEGTSESH